GRRLTLLVRHGRLLRLDSGHAQARALVAVAAATPIVLPALELEDAELGAPEVLDHLGRQARALHVGLAHGDRVAVAHHEHLIEGEALARFPGKEWDHDQCVGLHLGLIAVDVHDRVHRFLLAALALGPMSSSEVEAGGARRHRDLRERVFLAWHAGNGQATRRRRWGPRRRPGSWYHPAMKATLVAVLFLLAGCMAGGPPLKTGAPAAAEPASPLGSPFATRPAGESGVPLVIDRTDLRIGTTVQFNRIPSASELYDLRLLLGLAHVVLSLPAWP